MRTKCQAQGAGSVVQASSPRSAFLLEASKCVKAEGRDDCDIDFINAIVVNEAAF